MTWSGAGSTSAFAVTIILALAVGGFVLWYSPGEGSFDAISIDDVPPPGQSVGDGLSRPIEPVVAPVPEASGEEEIAPPPVSLESDERAPQPSPSGPFIDADDDAGDYSFSPVSDIGEFLDADAD